MTISKVHHKPSTVSPATGPVAPSSSPGFVPPPKTEGNFDTKRFRDLTKFSSSGSVSIVARAHPRLGLAPQAAGQLERALEYVDEHDPRLTSDGGWFEQALKLGA